MSVQMNIERRPVIRHGNLTIDLQCCTVTFSKSIRGAQASATVYSITETALLNGLKPYNYLSYVLEKMKDLGAFPAKEEMIELLPWSSSLPEDCRRKFKK